MVPFLTRMDMIRRLQWDRERSEPQYQANLRAVFWEAVVPELIFKPDS